MLDSRVLDRRSDPYSGSPDPAEQATDCPLTDALARLGSTVLVERNGEIFADGEPAEHVYKVLSGVVRISTYTEDGRRQISAFHFPGEVFGLQAEPAYIFSAEAVTPCKLSLVRRSALRAEAERNPSLCGAICQSVTQAFSRLQAHVVLLGRKSAQERVTVFLRRLAERQSTSGLIELPMSRQDIADHLGLTIETVSRTMTQLQDLGVIALDGSRRVKVQARKLAA